MQIRVGDHGPQGDPGGFDPQGLTFDRLQRHLQPQLFGQRRAAQTCRQDDVPCREGESGGVNRLQAKGGIRAALNLLDRLVEEKAGSLALGCFPEGLG
jgi:hypothetical protein